MAKCLIKFIFVIFVVIWSDFLSSFLLPCSFLLQRPSSIRIDQLDRTECKRDPTGNTFPDIVHHGVRPAQLSYAGDPM